MRPGHVALLGLACGSLLLSGGLALADPQGTTPAPAPKLTVRQLSLEHPDVELTPVLLEDWRLEVGLPAGWVVEESGDVLRFVAPDHLPNCGITLMEEPELAREDFFATIWESLAAEPGMSPQQAGLAPVGDITVPLVWAVVELQADEKAVFHQILGFYEFAADEIPFIATASAPASLWAAAAPELESILGHLRAMRSEEDAFSQLEQRVLP